MSPGHRSRRRRRAQLPGRRRHDRLPGVARRRSTSPARVIVVDNGSGDGSAERLAAVPGVELIVNDSQPRVRRRQQRRHRAPARRRHRVRVGAQQRHRGRAGDAARRCSPSPTPTRASAPSARCSTTWPTPRSRADVGRRGASAGGPVAPAMPAATAIGSTTSPRRRCCCGPRPSVRSACSTPATSSPGRTSTCAPGWSPRGWRLAVAERARVWHRWGGTLEPLAPRRLEEHAAGLVVYQRTPLAGAVADDAADARLLRRARRCAAASTSALWRGGVAGLARAGWSPVIHIVVPNWNGAAHLGPCIRSLAAQDHDDFEIVVVDNGSVDDSLAVLDALAGEIAPVPPDRAAQRRQPRLRRRCQPGHPPRHRRRGRRRRPVQQRRRRRRRMVVVAGRACSTPTPTWRSSPVAC